MLTVQSPWESSVAEVLSILKVKPQEGLSKKEAEDRIRRFGLNTLKEEPKISAFSRILTQVKNPVIISLLIATIISLLLGETIDAIAIIIIVIINIIISYLEETKAEAAINALKKLSTPNARVIRGGNILQVKAINVCIGDILVLESGDCIPADCRIIQFSQLSTNESILTGESFPVNKESEAIPKETILAERKNMLFAGTAVATGTAKAVVTSIGTNTEIGKIFDLLVVAEQSKTPLQKRFEQLSNKLLMFCLFIILIVAFLGVVNKNSLFDILMTAISLAVAAIPEGLPTVVTLSLAIAARRMAKRNAIVRHLPAIETLGATNVICTDKTGTLTSGKMRVREIFTLSEKLIETKDLQKNISENAIKLITCSALCCNASLGDNGEESGDATEIALLYLAKRQNINIKLINIEYQRLAEWSFDSTRKRMSVAVQNNNTVIICSKGAPEEILKLCNVNSDDKKTILDTVEILSEQGRRVLAIAERIFPITPSKFYLKDYSNSLLVENNLKFLGLIAIADEPRKESIEAIKVCKSSGIEIVMVTGDHPTTAKAIAKELGIIEENSPYKTLTGIELEQMSQEELLKEVDKIKVYARVSPEDKVKIIQAWKDNGNIVAMTGDGVNDAPALKEASIGVSMGKSGTDVARQSSSIVLMDDNFATIVSAVQEGRAIYGNIRRTVQYLISSNLAEILIMLGAAILAIPAPLAPIHLLWINLVTDGFPALALAAEAVPKNVLAITKKPSPNTFFDKDFYKEVAFVCMVTSIIALIIYLYSLKFFNETIARTNIFSFVIFAELFRSFSSRSDQSTIFQLGFTSNLYHLLAVAVPVLFQFALNYSKFFHDFFKIQYISLYDYIVVIILALVPVVILEIRKFIIQLNLFS